jgi:hypothetical protein
VISLLFSNMDFNIIHRYNVPSKYTRQFLQVHKKPSIFFLVYLAITLPSVICQLAFQKMKCLQRWAFRFSKHPRSIFHLSPMRSGGYPYPLGTQAIFEIKKAHGFYDV